MRRRPAANDLCVSSNITVEDKPLTLAAGHPKTCIQIVISLVIHFDNYLGTRQVQYHGFRPHGEISTSTITDAKLWPTTDLVSGSLGPSPSRSVQTDPGCYIVMPWVSLAPQTKGHGKASSIIETPCPRDILQCILNTHSPRNACLAVHAHTTKANR